MWLRSFVAAVCLSAPAELLSISNWRALDSPPGAARTTEPAPVGYQSCNLQIKSPTDRPFKAMSKLRGVRISKIN